MTKIKEGGELQRLMQNVSLATAYILSPSM